MGYPFDRSPPPSKQGFTLQAFVDPHPNMGFTDVLIYHYQNTVSLETARSTISIDKHTNTTNVTLTDLERHSFIVDDVKYYFSYSPKDQGPEMKVYSK